MTQDIAMLRIKTDGQVCAWVAFYIALFHHPLHFIFTYCTLHSLYIDDVIASADVCTVCCVHCFY
jgi:hypothetical protein